MPWFDWFCFLTAPAVVGVAFTLSCPDSTRSTGLSAMIAIGFFWSVAAFLAQKQLREFKPQGWVRWWMLLCLLLPLGGLFANSLRSDPAFLGVFERHNKAVALRDPGGLAPAAPTRHALSWSEVGELVACVRPRAWRYSLQLLTCLPPVWWLAAFGIAVWRGT